jgi:hypothetical protein
MINNGQLGVTAKTSCVGELFSALTNPSLGSFAKRGAEHMESIHPLSV